MAHKGGKREKAVLKYDRFFYTPIGSKNATEKELRREYSRLRSIARKRLERIKGTEFEESEVFRWNYGKYKPLKEIKTRGELNYLLYEVSRFVTAETGSLSGLKRQRDEMIKTFHEHGYTFVNRQNFKRFTDFMESMRIKNLNRIYDSKRLAEFYETAERKKLSEEEMQRAFRKWQKHEKKRMKIRHRDPRKSDLYRRDF